MQKIIKVKDRQSLQQTQSAPNLKEKQVNATKSKGMLKINIKVRISDLFKY
jgi:hypothetical protein